MSDHYEEAERLLRSGCDAGLLTAALVHAALAVADAMYAVAEAVPAQAIPGPPPWALHLPNDEPGDLR